MNNPTELNEQWRRYITAPEYAALLRELDDLGCQFEWRNEADIPTFIARQDGETIAKQHINAHEDPTIVVYDVINQAADAVEVLA